MAHINTNTTEGKLAVMTAQLRGARIVYRKKENNYDSWKYESMPNWNWGLYDYKIEEVVDPYKKFKDALKAGKRVKCGPTGKWQDKKSCTLCWACDPSAYEIEPDPIYVPWTIDDVPLVCWIREIKPERRLLNGRSMIIKTREDYVIAYGTEMSYKELFDYYEYALPDGKTWIPCRKLRK